MVEPDAGRGSPQQREAMGFMVSVGFVCLAAVRDVYFGGLLQHRNPLEVAVVAFALRTLILLPVALMQSPADVVALLRRPRALWWVNASSALAWLGFLGALRCIEPVLVQVLYSAIGPLAVVSIDRHRRESGLPVPVTLAERRLYVGLGAALADAAAVALGGRSGAGPRPVGTAALGVLFAAGGGIAISVSTTLCRRLNDAGALPVALLAVRYPLTAVAAGVFVLLGSSAAPATGRSVDAVVLIAAALIIVPSYVNQVGIALASPLTVRVVLATGPVPILGAQLVEGRPQPLPTR
jgi:drug/metabolite transporter (DMT)-like permease